MLTYKHLKILIENQPQSFKGYTNLEIKIIKILQQICYNISSNFEYYKNSSNEHFLMLSILKADFDIVETADIHANPVNNIIFNTFYFNLYLAIKAQEPIFNIRHISQFVQTNSTTADLPNDDLESLLLVYLYKLLQQDNPTLQYKPLVRALYLEKEQKVNSFSLWWIFFGVFVLFILIVLSL